MYIEYMGRNKDFVYLNAFVWDTAKNELNKQKHGLSFETAVRIFNDPCMTKQFDNLNSSLEEARWKCIGRDIQGGYSTLTVSMTERGELKRIFSARKANQQEVKEYEENATAYI